MEADVQEVRQPGGMAAGTCRAKARRGLGAAMLSRAVGLGTELPGGGARRGGGDSISGGTEGAMQGVEQIGSQAASWCRTAGGA
jgi:hypothetical protein